MKSTYRPAWDFIRGASSCGSLDELQDLFGKALEPFEFDRFSCALALGPNRSRVRMRVLFGRSYADWDNYYLSRGYLRKDPCVKKLFTASRIFAWDETPWDELSSAGKQIRVEASEAGAGNGVVIPVPGDEDELYCVRFSTPEKKLNPDSLMMLTTLGQSYCVQGARVLEAPGKKGLGKSPLSQRESECLAWVSEGKSDWDISEILNISQWTVHEHIERAKTKLGVRSRVQAVMKSANNGWLPNNPS
ncbi:MAG TPA: LuxR family transcriptional regulator [Rhizomicrobium sp.]|jgi:LuxR family transcriptional activator of conjugal transfer of Ti plasmids|nr:LuxR family transcriptional regulator [Rhizomicrobium sp.]